MGSLAFFSLCCILVDNAVAIAGSPWSSHICLGFVTVAFVSNLLLKSKDCLECLLSPSCDTYYSYRNMEKKNEVNKGVGRCTETHRFLNKTWASVGKRWMGQILSATWKDHFLIFCHSKCTVHISAWLSDGRYYIFSSISIIFTLWRGKIYTVQNNSCSQCSIPFHLPLQFTQEWQVNF